MLCSYVPARRIFRRCLHRCKRSFATRVNEVASLGLSQEGEHQYVSFFKYAAFPAKELSHMRSRMLKEWGQERGVLGRVYIAEEGINAQCTVPKAHAEGMGALVCQLDDSLQGIPITMGSVVNFGVALPFKKLQVKIRPHLVADSLAIKVDVLDSGKRLHPPNFHEYVRAINAKETQGVIVDTRNYYEHRVGNFEGAKLMASVRFQETIADVTQALEGVPIDMPVLLYCTGGIRCEKVGAYLKQVRGFTNVNSLRGGINSYSKFVTNTDTYSLYRGTNFVFDQRRSERVTADIMTHCDQCRTVSDRSTNCHFCNLLFVQCTSCRDTLAGHCSTDCYDASQRPPKVQYEMKRALREADCHPNCNGKFFRPTWEERIRVQYSDVWRHVLDRDVDLDVTP
jgi:UPF0176 protein